MTHNSQVMAWLTYEVLVFYYNIVSLSVFIFIQNFKKFNSIRDRLGLAGDSRKKTDFLQYSKEDVHYWSAYFIEICLIVSALTFRAGVHENIRMSVYAVIAKHTLGAYLIRQLYFNSKFQFKTKTKVALLLSVFANIFLVFQYIELEKSNSKWWEPAVLLDIVMYFVIFIQMFIEWMSWG